MEEEVEEEDDDEKSISMMDILREKVRQDVQRKARSAKSTDLKIYSTVQLATEIEAIKTQERSLMTKVEG